MGVSTRLFAVSAAFIFALASPALAASCTVADEDIAQNYDGPCVNGKAQGHGKASGRDTYEGDFVAGQEHGKGVYVWGLGFRSPGDRYEGDWLNGKRTGKGVQIWGPGSKNNPGDRYEGDWRNDERVGKGVWTRGAKNPCPKLDANTFCLVRMEGKFEKGNLTSGKITFSDGDTYTGDVGLKPNGNYKLQHATARGRGGDGDATKVFEDFLGGVVGTTRNLKEGVGGGLRDGANRSSGGGRQLFECKAECAGTTSWIAGSTSLTVQADNHSDAYRVSKENLKRQCEAYPFYPDGSGQATLGYVNCHYSYR